MPIRNLLIPAVLLLAVSPLGVMGQTYSVMPTYQQSIAEYESAFVQSDFRALGIMVGVERPGRWWSPHIWVQRYELESVRRENLPGGLPRDTDGWSVSVGPAVTLVDTPPARLTLISQVGLDARSRGELTGGGGIHIGWKAGAFRPQAFGRFQVIRGYWYTTLGVGVKFSFNPSVR